ncbi:(R)-mandelonitrile lyase [Oceanicella actignis]|uniref:Cupin domain protein n=1 Tax=Oceanicella actignis TaxID=1189325 RepID=A0A1M7RWH1_9RHOB|nr:cupin domain-containing protein [Oceanicella actignis]SET01256.1 Cupin domain protein [Oceanicella actignis]SHN50352.1 Cupin domain protein [Oceanicella actignis]
MKIETLRERAARRAPEDYFVGEVWMQTVAAPEAPSRLSALTVSFAPGARTAWHTHPAGQTLLILSGRCRVQSRGGPVRELGPGDVVRFAPGEEHWHGAAPDQPMTHLAMQEAVDGVTAHWLEQVSQDDYLRPPQD